MPIVSLPPGKSLALSSSNNYKYTVHNVSQTEDGVYAIALSNPPIAVTHDIAPNATNTFTIDQQGGVIDNRGTTDLAVTTPGL